VVASGGRDRDGARASGLVYLSPLDYGKYQLIDTATNTAGPLGRWAMTAG
jgi:hypothetical protein